MYGQMPIAEWWLGSIAIIPTVIGVIAALLPAINAVRTEPVEGMKGSYQLGESKDVKF